MSDEKEVVLQVNNLKQFFITGRGKYRIFNKAVNGINFSVNRGEVFSLVGESGCGKTTTGRTIMRLYKPTDGEVYLLGHRIGAGYLSLKKDIKNARKKIVEIKAKKNETNAEEIQTLTEKIKLLKEEISSRKNDQAKKYRPSKESILEVKKQSKIKIDELKNELLMVQNSMQELKKTAFVEYDNADKTLSQDILDELHSRLLNEYRKQRAELRRRVNDINSQISHLSTSHLFYARPLLNKIQMIFQDPIDSLDPRMTVMDIIAEGLVINGIKNKVVTRERVYEALKMVGLMPEHASHFPHEFSGGQRQRVGIARAIVCEPEVIVADEPISALDVSIQAQVINLLNDLKEKLGLTILFIAHDLSVVKYFSDKIAVMYYGHIVEIGDKNRIFSHPLHPYTQSLISSIPLPDPDYENLRTDVKKYNPMAHGYQKNDEVVLREIEENHYVLCNQKEFDEYKIKVK